MTQHVSFKIRCPQLWNHSFHAKTHILAKRLSTNSEEMPLVHHSLFIDIRHGSSHLKSHYFSSKDIRQFSTKIGCSFSVLIYKILFFSLFLYLHSIGRLIQAVLRSLIMQQITPGQKLSGCSVTLTRQFKGDDPHPYFFACTPALTSSLRSSLIPGPGGALSCPSGLSRSMAAPWETLTDPTTLALRKQLVYFGTQHKCNLKHKYVDCLCTDT